MLPCCAVQQHGSWVQAGFDAPGQSAPSLTRCRGRQAAGQRAGVRFLKHNIRDEFDDVTDIAAFYRVKSVPSFLFLVGGAQARARPRTQRLQGPVLALVGSPCARSRPGCSLPRLKRLSWHESATPMCAPGRTQIRLEGLYWR